MRPEMVKSPDLYSLRAMKKPNSVNAIAALRWPTTRPCRSERPVGQFQLWPVCR